MSVPDPPGSPTAAHQSFVETENAADQTLFLIDVAGRILTWNPGVEHVLGYSREEWIGQSVSLLFSPEDRAAGIPVQALETARTRGHVTDVRWYVRKNGSQFFAESRITPLYNAAGTLIGYSNALRDATTQQAEARLAATLTSIGDAVMVTDAQGRVTLLNPVAEQLTGWTTAEALGLDSRTVFDIINETTRAVVESPVQRVLREGTVVGLANHTILRRRDGTEISIDDSGAPVRDAPGNLLGVVLVFRDISDRRAAEEALRVSEERLRLATEAAQIGTWDFTPSTGELRWDERCKALFGLPPDAHIDYSVFLAGLHPDDREPSDAAVQRALRGEAGGDYDIEYRTVGLADGGVVRWIAARGRAIMDAEGRAERFIGTVIDISERKEMEAVLRERDERFQAVARATRDAVWDWHLTTDAVSWNEGVYSMFGYTPEQVAPDAAWWYERIHPDDRERVVHSIHEIIDGAGDGQSWSDEYRYLRADGSYADILDRGYVVRNAEGQPIHMVGAMMDQTERRRTERALAAALAKNERIAETLQRSMLLTSPEQHTFEGLLIGTHYEAAWDEAQIGGDFFDAFPLDGGVVALVVGDSTGKGLAAARYISEIQFVLRAYLRESPNPAVALERLNNYLVDGQRLDKRAQNALVAVVVAVVDCSTGATVVAAGGAEPPLVCRAETGMAEETRVTGVTLGANPNTRYDTERLVLQPGDLLVLTTDGLTEARNRETRTFFGYGGFMRAVEEGMRSRISLTALAHTTVARAREFAGGALADDVCILAARRD